MYKWIALVSTVAIALCFLGIDSQAVGPASEGIPTTCLGCLCEAVSGCNRTKGCSGDICGLFHITWGYWSDAGKPVQPGQSPDEPQAWTNCVTEVFCAARAVQGYMNKFQQDCNQDGRIDCLDYALIHKLGGYGCQGTLPEPFGSKLGRCLQEVGYQQQ